MLERETKIKIVASLTLLIFLLQNIVGYLTRSIALVADSIHMVSDLVALLVALHAIHLAKQRTHSAQFTFGFQRAEILGALANGLYLLALCFTIVVDIIKRFAEPTGVKNLKLVLIVGCVGLGANLLGMVMFGGHLMHSHSDEPSHSHGGNHNHSESSHNEHSHAEEKHSLKLVEMESTAVPSSSARVPMRYGAHAHASIIAAADGLKRKNAALQRESLPSHEHSHHHGKDFHASHSHGAHNHQNMNMQWVFLHLLVDALGSVGVIASSLIPLYTTGSWRVYIDPLISLLISGLIVSTSVPLVRSASFILQGAPSSVSMDGLSMSLPGVLKVHELRGWGLSDEKAVASVPIRCPRPSPQNPQEWNYMHVASSVKRLLRTYGICSTTVQPEYPMLRSSDSVSVGEC
ncbi:cation efflux protein [Chytriomyces cf. hyalinus JEL632]|nr:cation efflux protein [Chytriomyces cf. hyalinus JEL632]